MCISGLHTEDSLPKSLTIMNTLPIISFVAVCAGAWALVRLLRPLFHTHGGLRSSLPRYPHTIPFLGLDLVKQIWVDFQTGQYSEGSRRRHVSFGRTFSASTWGKEYIYTIEPQNILTITKHEARNFEKSKWASEAAKYIGNGILLNEGGEWSRSRSMLRPVFTSKVAEEPTFIEPHVRRLVTQMMLLGNTEGKLEFHRLADMFMLDIVTEFLFGKSTSSLEFPRSPEGEDAVKFLMLVRSFDGPSASFIATGMPARFEMLFSGSQLNKAVVGMKDFFKRKLADLMVNTEEPSSQNAPWSVFRTMRAAGFSDDQVQAELQNIFFASWDTTSALLANTVYALLRHQRIQERLREEVRTLRGIPPTKQQLKNMKYLQLVVNETLRLYSPVTSHSRTAKVDTTLPRGGGQNGQHPIFVRAGTTITWSTYSLNRDPRWYGQDWAEFRPERWVSLTGSTASHSMVGTATDDETCTESDTDRGQFGGSGTLKGFFLPFGGSSNRACPGQFMARAEVMYAIVRILQELPLLECRAEHTQFREAKAVSFCPAEGVWVSVNRDRHHEVGESS